jgi:hypothetical protein
MSSEADAAGGGGGGARPTRPWWNALPTFVWLAAAAFAVGALIALS